MTREELEKKITERIDDLWGLAAISSGTACYQVDQLSFVIGKTSGAKDQIKFLQSILTQLSQLKEEQ